MSLFAIPVGDLLQSYAGDSKELSFSGEVYDGFYEDLRFVSPLDLSIKVIGLDDGICVIFQHLQATVEYEGEQKEVTIEGIERTFKETVSPDHTNDIKYVDMKHSVVDLSEIIREEILLQCV